MKKVGIVCLICSLSVVSVSSAQQALSSRLEARRTDDRLRVRRIGVSDQHQDDERQQEEQVTTGARSVAREVPRDAVSERESRAREQADEKQKKVVASSL